MANFHVSIQPASAVSLSTKLEFECARGSVEPDFGKQRPWPKAQPAEENEWKEIPLDADQMGDMLSLFEAMKDGVAVDQVFLAINNL